MQKQYLYIIKHALANGLTVRVWDSEDQEWLCKPTDSYQIAKDHIESMCWTNLRIYRGEKSMGTFAIILECGQEPEETINDYTITPYTELATRDYYEGRGTARYADLDAELAAIDELIKAGKI